MNNRAVLITGISSPTFRKLDLEKEVETLKAKINASIAISEDCTPYKTKIAALEAEIVKLKASKEDCTPYKSKISTLEAEISKLKSEQSNLVEEKNKVEIAIEEAKNRIVKLFY